MGINRDPVLRNAAEICKYVKRDHRKIKELLDAGLPAWKEDGVYYALPDDLDKWLRVRRDMFLKK